MKRTTGEVITAHGVHLVAFTVGKPVCQTDQPENLRGCPDEPDVSTWTNGTVFPGRCLPENASRPGWTVDTECVHDRPGEQADQSRCRGIHSRTRSHVEGGMVETVDPVENEEFCANCRRICVIHEAANSAAVTDDGRLNYHDDQRSMGSMSKAEIREPPLQTVENRVSQCSEFLIEQDGQWVLDDVCTETPRQPVPPAA